MYLFIYFYVLLKFYFEPYSIFLGGGGGAQQYNSA